MTNLQIATQLGLTLQEYSFLLAADGLLCGVIASFFLMKTLQY